MGKIMKEGIQYGVGGSAQLYELKKGTYDLKGIYPAHSSGSGNYLSFCIPYKLADDITSASMSSGTNMSIYIDDQTILGHADIDLTYCEIEKYALMTRIELKFNSTQVLNKMATIRISVGTFTFA